MSHASLLSDLVDLDAALQSDSSTDLESRKQRDRGIGQSLQDQRERPPRQLHGWLNQVRIAGWKRDGHAAVRLYHLLCVVLVVAGLVAGWGLARAALYYTGDRPINIFNAIGLLVLPQILWVLAAVPWKLPLFGSLQSSLRLLNPGQLARRLAGLLPASGRSGLDVVWDPDNALVMAPAARWLLSFWSQLFSVWFNIGVLAALVYLVSFSDLAFAWSTTLTLDNATFHRGLSILAWPWHAILPGAVPGPELVEISRYYRLEDGALGTGGTAPGTAALLGGWWPFLVAAVLCYGLLPRLVTLLIAWLRFRHHLERALPRLPGAAELLARMNSPLVSTAARSAATVATTPPPGEGAAPAPVPAGTRCTVIDWSASVGGSDELRALEPGLRALGVEPLSFADAGGARSTAQDTALIASLCAAPGEGVAVTAKAWEPPLLEFVDFLRNVRARCDHRQPIIVVLWGGREGVTGRDRETWGAMLRQLQDPDLHIETLGSVP